MVYVRIIFPTEGKTAYKTETTNTETNKTEISTVLWRTKRNQYKLCVYLDVYLYANVFELGRWVDTKSLKQT